MKSAKYRTNLLNVTLSNIIDNIHIFLMHVLYPTNMFVRHLYSKQCDTKGFFRTIDLANQNETTLSDGAIR